MKICHCIMIKRALPICWNESTVNPPYSENARRKFWDLLPWDMLGRVAGSFSRSWLCLPIVGVNSLSWKVKFLLDDVMWKLTWALLAFFGRCLVKEWQFFCSFMIGLAYLSNFVAFFYWVICKSSNDVVWSLPVSSTFKQELFEFYPCGLIICGF